MFFLNPQNPVIGPRAFGTTAQNAAKNACDYYLGLKESGILGCAKHFPGHGDTNQDSHIELPSLNLTVEDFAMRLIPFQALIEQRYIDDYDRTHFISSDRCRCAWQLYQNQF